MIADFVWRQTGAYIPSKALKSRTSKPRNNALDGENEWSDGENKWPDGENEWPDAEGIDEDDMDEDEEDDEEHEDDEDGFDSEASEPTKHDQATSQPGQVRFSNYATISRSWQAAVERLLFESITIDRSGNHRGEDPDDSFDKAKRTLDANGGRWRYLRTLGYQYTTSDQDTTPEFHRHMQEVLGFINRNLDLVGFESYQCY